ncbi:MAG TPA: NAD(P)H-binding protein [Devosia sp.]
MSGGLLVVGGYGAVGEPLCRALTAAGILPVIAGRNPQKGVALAHQLGTTTRRLDLTDPGTWDAALAGIDIVVMCMDQEDTALVRLLFERGIHYVDVTASDAFFRRLEALPAPDRSIALLSVGLAPGLTNMLARGLAGTFDRPTRVDIGMLFGLGDHPGAAGLDWMAEQIFDPHRRRDLKRQDFGPTWGTRRAHVLDFSDQHALMRTMPNVAVTTRIAFESRLVTAALFGIGSWFAGNGLVRGVLRRSFPAFRLGSRTVNLSVEAVGYRHGNRRRSSVRFLAEGESRTTARLAALMIRMLMARPPRPGIWHSHEALNVPAFLSAVETEGIGTLDWSWIPPTLIPTTAMAS